METIDAEKYRVRLAARLSMRKLRERRKPWRGLPLEKLLLILAATAV
jgi:hypothetical protein